MKSIEAENAQLKRIVANLTLEITAIKDVLGKKWWALKPRKDAYRPWKPMACRREEPAGLLGHVEEQSDAHRKKAVRKSFERRSKRLLTSEGDLVIVESIYF